ncbi:Laccase-22 [Hibiscus syriacus]|uniref:laccase n=1 Tax=Hibiscus syriacus TaxID=106335 RepID=A0A6A2XEA7_HIBSY|nr:Laccase-22 [Hibiscus syriacus]
MAASIVRILMLIACLWFPASVECMVRHYKFNVVLKNTTRLCSTKPIVTVNGRYPGPTLVAREDDIILVKAVNHVKYNVSIDWLGRWAGIYNTVPDSTRSELRLQLHIDRPKRHPLVAHSYSMAESHRPRCNRYLAQAWCSYPFPKPHKEEIVILGEWWKSDVEAVINEALKSGLAPNVSDAHTINGHPGSSPSCSSKGGYKLAVKPGKTYMLRIVNASKPFKTDTIVISPGQTTNVLLTTNSRAGKYLVVASPFMDASIAVDNVTATATLYYSGSLTSTATTLVSPPPKNATSVATSFTNALRSLNSKQYLANVPLKIDHSLLFTVGLGINPCPTCVNGSRVVASINNVSFVMPKTALLQAHFFNINAVFTSDFPGNPPVPFNYTSTQLTNLATKRGTKLYRLGYNDTVQLVLLEGEWGIFDPKKDPKNFNLVDTVERNTIGVPPGGWTAMRFRADNPGVWFMHCHLEVHTTCGLKMAFVMDNGKGPNESLLPPPSDLPK